MKNILCTTSSFGNYSPHIFKKLKSKGLNPVLNPFQRKLTPHELQELLLKHRPVALLAGTEEITGDVLHSAKDFLKVISRVGVGWDNVDHGTVSALGIKIYRTEGVLNNAVAELALGMMLSALRNIPLQDREIRTGKWQKYMGSMLNGKVVGVIGYGAIGQRVGELCHAFGAQIIYYDPVPKSVPYADSVSREDLISGSDIITIHADGSGSVLGKKELEMMHQGIILVNTARGGMIDEKALESALSSGKVACACLDVFEQEPYNGPLAHMDNVVLTAHIGSYAKEARVIMEEMAVENMLTGLGVS